MGIANRPVEISNESDMILSMTGASLALPAVNHRAEFKKYVKLAKTIGIRAGRARRHVLHGTGVKDTTFSPDCKHPGAALYQKQNVVYSA